MIGRYRPPHKGHYHGLRAILYGDENEFLLPLDTYKELLNIDKVFIGIARYDISKDNPFSVGQVREIWRQIIDEDTDLKRRSNDIEIVSCPSSRTSTNVLNAIHELTYNTKSIIVISGNDRIIAQCNENNIQNYQFKRLNHRIKGEEIRNIISKADFDNFDENDELIQNLINLLHPTAFETMRRDSLFQCAQNIINAI